jgi:hypothetical protein
VRTQADRIAYYIRKANEYGAQRFDYIRGRSVKKPPASRYRRLLAYKGGITRE